jgi:hypothetical protein
MTPRNVQLHIGRLIVHPDALPHGENSAENVAMSIRVAIRDRLAQPHSPPTRGSNDQLARTIADGVLGHEAVAGHLRGTGQG